MSTEFLFSFSVGLVVALAVTIAILKYAFWRHNPYRGITFMMQDSEGKIQERKVVGYDHSTRTIKISEPWVKPHNTNSRASRFTIVKNK